MKKIINLCVLMSLALFISGCAIDAMKAPCDQQGHFCGRKIKINQW
jgi:hypothetical protein